MRKVIKSRQSKQKHTCPHKKIPSNEELGNALADIWEIFKYIEEDVRVINKKLGIEGNTIRALKLYKTLKRRSSDAKASSHRETYVSSESESGSSTESDTDT
jgi:hypothetical protein